MQRVDVAIQSYKKPESLIYTLMSLHKVSGRHIEHVFINDDCSGGNISSIYLHESVKAFLKPWKIHFRENTHPVRWGEKRAMVRGYSPKYYNQWQIIRRHARALFKRDVHVTSPENIRYQWALCQSEKKFLFILHDDIEFYDDIVGLYLTRMCPGVAIVGDLGQCWRCGYGKQDPPCSPEKIVNKEFPSLNWPRTIPGQGQSSLDCRINEWCCMISREAALELERKERCFFGNYDMDGDVGAYWFYQAVRHGYGFDDPLPTRDLRSQYYRHPWQGHSGHSVWVDQGKGKSAYDRQKAIGRMREKFGMVLPAPPPAAEQTNPNPPVATEVP